MGIPKGVRAVLEALRIKGADREKLGSLTEKDWESALHFCDRAQLTLTLGALCGDALPPKVRERIEEDARKNTIKFARLMTDFEEIAEALERRGIDFAVLKGFTHSPDFTADPLWRAQGDIDLWCPRETARAAYDTLIELGYAPYCETEGRHLPPLLRPSDWEWRGDFHDPGMPIAVDIHYLLWDAALERIQAPGIEDFWERRVERSFGGRRTSTLHPADALAFASLHQMLHVLRGDARMQRAWEIANFLEIRLEDDAFWARWKEMHPEPLRRLEAIVFRMSAEWFGGDLPGGVREEIDRLPDDAKLWLDRYALAPVENLFKPNKHELWLHLALVGSLADGAAVFRRRVFPMKTLTVNESPPDVGALEKWRKRAPELAWMGWRIVHHARALPPTLMEGVTWWWARKELGAPFVRFLLASALFDLGAFVFFVLYNLYLLDLGFHEKYMGLVSGAMTAGTLAGALPAAALARKVGLRTTLLAAILGGAVASALRAIFPQEGAMLVTAFLNGAFFSLWAVSLSPAVAGLSSEKNRSFAFSLVFAQGIGIGVAGGLVAGRLPGVFAHRPFSLGTLEAKRAALFVACGMIALAAPAVARVRLASPPASDEKIYPRSAFVRRFLMALFVWIFATGLFNPFFNAYFARLGHLSVERIGLVFSASQLVQVGAILLAPAVLRRLGEVTGVAAMQFAAAAALACLALAPAGGGAIAIYPVYMAFQYMSSPAVFSMLMGRVSEHERSGASAMNFVVSSLAGMAAAFAGGWAIGRYGYPATMGAAAAMAGLAALLFRVLLHEPSRGTA